RALGRGASRSLRLQKKTRFRYERLFRSETAAFEEAAWVPEHPARRGGVQDGFLLGFDLGGVVADACRPGVVVEVLQPGADHDPLASQLLLGVLEAQVDRVVRP